MLDLFAIAVMVLSLFLAPPEATVVHVDVLQLDSGRIETVRAERVAGGFRLLGQKGEIAGTVMRDGPTVRFAIKGQEPLEFPLGATIDMLTKQRKSAVVKISEKQVRVMHSPDLTYVQPHGVPRLMVVRAAQAAPERLAGWELFPDPWTLTRRAAPLVTPGGKTPLKAVVHFAASLMRGDAALGEVLAASMKPAAREALLKRGAAAAGRVGFSRFTPMAWIRVADLAKAKGPLAKTATELSAAEGCDAVLLAQDGRGRDLLFALDDQGEKGWKILALRAPLVSALNAPPK